MKRPSILFPLAAAFTGCVQVSVPRVTEAGVVVATLEQGKFLLASGERAYVDLGQKKGWLKITLEKNGWDRGSVTVFFSEVGGFARDQQPHRVYTDQLDPCVIELKEFGVSMVLTGGTATASYIELVSGAGARLMNPRAGKPNKAPEPTPTSVTPRAT